LLAIRQSLTDAADASASRRRPSATAWLGAADDNNLQLLPE